MKHRKKTEEARQAKEVPGNSAQNQKQNQEKPWSSTNMQAQDYH
jgi:hypothetical protein